MTDNSSDFKVVAVINKNLPQGVALNAIAHLGLGLSALVDKEDRKRLHFLDFIDMDGETHPSISARSLVVLSGSSSHIKSFRKSIKEHGYPSLDFIKTMTEGDYISQIERTKKTTENDMEYFGVMVFAKSEELRPLTRKFSLWK